MLSVHVQINVKKGAIFCHFTGLIETTGSGSRHKRIPTGTSAGGIDHLRSTTK